MALKEKIVETLVLGGVGYVGQKLLGIVIDPLLKPIETPPALPPASSLSGYKITANEDQVQGFASAITRGVASAFGVPTAPPASAPVYAPPPAAYTPPSHSHRGADAVAVQASIDVADAPSHRPAPRKSCCADCRAGKPCCGVPDTSLGAFDDDVEDQAFDFLALGAGFDQGAIDLIDSRLDKRQKEYEARLAALQAAANKTDAAQQAEIARLQAKLEKLAKAQSRPRLNFGRPAAQPSTSRDPLAEAMTKFDALKAWLDKMQPPPAAAPAPAPAAAPAQPIIVTAPWGPPAPAPVPAAPSAPVYASAPAAASEMVMDPWQNADLLAMLAVSGVQDASLSGGASSEAPAACARTGGNSGVFPSCGC